MASKIWLLVEWIQHSNEMFPSYGVVKVKTSAYDPSELQPGSEIFIQTKHSKPQAAKIMRISEHKQYINDHKDLLERQNEHFRTIMKFCMQGMRDMKSENDSLNLTMKSDAHHSRDRRTAPQIVMANLGGQRSDSECEIAGSEVHLSRDRRSTSQVLMARHGASSTDTESELDNNVNHSRSLNRTVAKFSRQNSRKECKTVKVHKCAPWVTSTPLMIKEGQNVILHYNQETQTEPILLHPNIEAVENSIKVLYKLYQQFLNLFSKVNFDFNALETGIDESSDETSTDFDHYEYDVLTEHNFSATSSERISSECEPEVMAVANATETVNDETESNEPLSAIKTNAIEGPLSIIKANSIDRPLSARSNKSNTHAPKVRKIDGQSNNSVDNLSLKMSYDDELAAIGNGYAKVPFRLLNGIDWTSHTTATRHLLQAIFPRSVLATHSLTGKQSPAFMNRPPKKILDPKLVEDIVKIVSTRCNVPKNLVRNTITIKCTDEAKLYRNRQQYKLQRRTNDNGENIPPVAPSVDDVVMN